jgi:predicted secreted hydrolase
MAATALGQVRYPQVRSGVPLTFPRDHGAHPDFRTEWWYLTGQVRDTRGRELGIQITFFRNRPGLQEESPSAFAPKQLLFAHAAIADPAHGRLRHDQRAARAGLGLAEAAAGTTAVHIDDWSLDLDGERYRTRIAADTFTMELTFAATQALVLQGDRGVSRKGPRPEQSSYYYSRPHLATTGTLAIEGKPAPVQGIAWLDHEWSSEYLAPEAQGWDWVGLNLDDGGALMAFRIRLRDGGILWSGGSRRHPQGEVRVFTPQEIRFEPLRTWRSPRTGSAYPVAMRVQAGEASFDLEPLMDDQELDARPSVGTVYWEGAVRVRENGQPRGQGYLELTGYVRPLKL